MAASPPALHQGVLVGTSALETAVAAVGTALVVVGQIEPNAMERQVHAGANVPAGCQELGVATTDGC